MGVIIIWVFKKRTLRGAGGGFLSFLSDNLSCFAFDFDQLVFFFLAFFSLASWDES